MSEWCKEHITEKSNWFVTKSGKKIEIQDDWNFCPICGTPRPEPKKGLAEKLQDTWEDCSGKRYKTAIDYYKAEAQAALEHFSEIVDEFCGDSRSFTARELKKKFMESL